MFDPQEVRRFDVPKTSVTSRGAIVLRHRSDHEYHPWVTHWKNFETGGFCHGNYFETEREANADFERRVLAQIAKGAPLGDPPEQKPILVQLQHKGVCQYVIADRQSLDNLKLALHDTGHDEFVTITEITLSDFDEFMNCFVLWDDAIPITEGSTPSSIKAKATEVETPNPRDFAPEDQKYID